MEPLAGLNEPLPIVSREVNGNVIVVRFRMKTAIEERIYAVTIRDGKPTHVQTTGKRARSLWNGAVRQSNEAARAIREAVLIARREGAL